MSFLMWYTRGNAFALGRSKVWFCAHPEDTNTYLKPLSESIYDHNYRDWAVWYDQKPLEPYDDSFFRDLGTMQLFVVPITRKLLQTPNRAMDVEIPFAVKNHIPILPVMQEEGLVSAFNEAFGDMQYLDLSEQAGHEKWVNSCAVCCWMTVWCVESRRHFPNVFS